MFFLFPSLLALPFCFCMLSIFSIKTLKTLIIVISNPLLDNSNVWVIFHPGPCDCLFTSDVFCSCLWAWWLVIFCWKQNLTYWILGTEVHRLFPRGSMLFWLEVGLDFVVLELSEASNSSSVLIFDLPIDTEFPYILLREGLCLASLPAVIPVNILRSCWCSSKVQGRGSALSVWTKSLVLFCPWTVTFACVSQSFFFFYLFILPLHETGNLVGRIIRGMLFVHVQ